MMLYKPCCGRTCLLGGCDTRDAGGCYCVCRLIDGINMHKKLLAGKAVYSDGAIAWGPAIEKKILSEEERTNFTEVLKSLEKHLEKYKLRREICKPVRKLKLIWCADAIKWPEGHTPSEQQIKSKKAHAEYHHARDINNKFRHGIQMPICVSNMKIFEQPVILNDNWIKNTVKK